MQEITRLQLSQTNISQNKSKKIHILFRNSVPEMKSTTNSTFSIYKYPAKFIPQVIAYVLKEYAKPGMKIFDPFAGYGTVGIVAKLYGYDYELWDLNPMLDIIHHTATMSLPKIDIIKLIDGLKNSTIEFIPEWSNFEYWFPKEFIPVLAKSWGFVHSLNDESKYILLIPLLKVTKYFSFGDENVHKLYRSRYAYHKVENLLKTNWRQKFFNMLNNEVGILLRKITEYNQLKPKNVNYIIKSGIDTLESNLENEVNFLITSPPYLQAQEYIRSTKLELYWLGYKDEYIKNLSKKEIPYRTVKNIKIHSDTFYKYREKINESHLLQLYDRYFNAILSIFTRLGHKVTDNMFIFVGPAKIRTFEIPLDDIIVEHLSYYGWRHKLTYIDKIVSRVMFKSEVNPATGITDSRIKTEHLVVIKKGKNMHRILNSEIVSPTKFKQKFKDYFNDLILNLNNEYNINFTFDEFSDLLLAAVRVNEFGVITIQENKKYLNKSRVQLWIEEKIIPNMVIMNLDDEDIIRLLLFCIEITYQMFSGGTRATISQKGFRERRRTFESILVDQFVGKLGEVVMKKYLERKFNVRIELDWEISTEIERFRNDIMNAKKNISIKSSPSLAGVWAEADIGYDYGIFVKCFVPQPTILQFFIEVCGFTRLLDFAESKIPSNDALFKRYLDEMRNRIKGYKCGETISQLKGLVCGYFRTSQDKIQREGNTLPFLGKVRQERYFERIDNLKYKRADWEELLRDSGLIEDRKR